LDFGNSDLFRISIFDIRISPLFFTFFHHFHSAVSPFSAVKIRPRRLKTVSLFLIFSHFFAKTYLFFSIFLYFSSFFFIFLHFFPAYLAQTAQTNPPTLIFDFETKESKR